MNLGELREAIKDLPNDIEIDLTVEVADGKLQSAEVDEVYVDTDVDGTKILAIDATVYGESTDVSEAGEEEEEEEEEPAGKK